MCACTEPVRTGIGAVCVEYGRPKWPITMLNHTNILGTEYCFVFYFWHPMLVRPVMKRLFFLGKPRKNRLASLARLIINVHDTTTGTVYININIVVVYLSCTSKY